MELIERQACKTAAGKEERPVTSVGDSALEMGDKPSLAGPGGMRGGMERAC